MNQSTKIRIAVFYLLLIVFCCAPVWSVEYFINQDGSAHLYSSYILLELLNGNPQMGEYFAFNSISVPNSSGHWLMVMLLNFFSPFVVTKIIVTFTFAGLVGALGWLRYKTVGIEGVRTSFLLGAAIGFNWLWLCGFYNFLIGVCCFVLTVGLFYGWLEKMNWRRAIVLGFLFLMAYFSHIVSFAILAGSVFLLIFAAEKQFIKRNLICFFVALLPVLPLVLLYKTVSQGGGFYPVWRNLENPFSPVSWFMQLRTADSFILMSRKYFPFVANSSPLFSIFTPFLWIISGLSALAVATFKEKALFRLKSCRIFALLFAGTIAAAFLLPDDFGLSNGGVLRERFLICGLILAIPLFRAGNSPRIKRFAQICLLFVVIFQTATLWEYALQTDRQAKIFLSAATALAGKNRIAATIIFEDSNRFSSFPLSEINNFYGFENNRVVWDNYEIGHYLFPVVAKHPEDKQFVLDLTQNNVFVFDNSNANFEARLAKLERVLAENRQRIDALTVWGGNSRVEEILSRWFEPVFENGKIRIFNRKQF
jgi:hypothetical protein